MRILGWQSLAFAVFALSSCVDIGKPSSIAMNSLTSSSSLTAAPLQITSQPSNVAVNAGGSASFTVTASAESTITYQWLKNGVAIPTASTNALQLSNVSTADAASYSVTVSASGQSLTSVPALLTVNSAPVISQQPSSQSVMQGGSVSFNVGVTGTSPFTYQWKKNGASISGATSNVLNLSNLQTSDAASYTVSVSNVAGSATSNSATLTVTTSSGGGGGGGGPVAPTITQQPSSATVNAGGTATFSVVASGTAPMTYQWLKDGMNLSGATSATLSIASVTSMNAGSYTVTITNAGGSTTSSAAVLTVNSKPAITQQPTAATVNEGAAISFSVVASGTGLSYQWRLNGANLSDGAGISGSTTATLRLSAASSTSVGNYSVVVSNTAGSATSNSAYLTVNLKPVITTQPASTTGNEGSFIMLSVGANGTGLSYQWKKDGANLADGANISGSTASVLVVRGLTSASAGSYTVVVTNMVGSVTSQAAMVTINSKPAIIQQPASQTISQGSTLTLSVVSTGASLTYQWYKDGSAISGQTSATYSAANVQSWNSGSYTVTVSNTLGSVTSQAAIVTVNVPTPTQFKSVKIADQFSCGIAMDDTFWCWGMSLQSPWVLSLYPQQVNLNGKTILDYDVSNGYGTQLCFVFTDNTLRCDEANYTTMGFFPTTGLTGFKKVRGGVFGGCAIKTDDSLWCWGINGSGNLGVGDTAAHSGVFVQPTGLSGVADVAFGQAMTCAVLLTGKVYCWGENNYGQLGNGSTSASPATTPQEVPGITQAVKVSVNTHNACALLSTGSVVCWGTDTGDGESIPSWGSLGIASSIAAQTPKAVPGISGAVDLVGGNLGYCVRLSDSSMRCWGITTQNESAVYVPAIPLYSTTPIVPGGMPSQVAQISGSSNNFCALTSAGDLYCKGNNRAAQMGLGGGLNAQPKLLKSGVSTVAAGGESVCVTMPDGSAQCIGDNWNSQFGNSSLSARPYSTFQPVGMSGVKSIQIVSESSTTPSETCAVDGSGNLSCWGLCLGGLGYSKDACSFYEGGGTFKVMTNPTRVSLPSSVHSLTMLGGRSCALFGDGSFSCWGHNENGELGTGSATSVASGGVIYTATTNSLGSGFKKVASSSSATCLIGSDSLVRCLGNLAAVSSEEPLGPGYSATLTPVAVTLPGSAPAADLAMGGGHTCILSTAGAVYCQGRNADLQTGNANSFTYTQTQVTLPAAATQIAAGSDHSCALLTTGEVYCWGKNNYGQLGNGGAWSTTVNKINNPVPQKVAGLSNVASIYARGDQTCALTATNDAWCWGMVYYNEVDAVKVHW